MRRLAVLFALRLAQPLLADGHLMTPDRAVATALALDPEARATPNGAEFTVLDVPVLMILDPVADRIRVMVPIRSAETLTEAELLRMMQANFDSALDARYAVARGRAWPVYLHPLAALDRPQLVAGIGQAVNAALSYGTLYSSGAMQFGGGDSGEALRRQLEELLERGEEL